MKVKLRTKIDSAVRGSNSTVISITGAGKAETSNINAQEASLTGTLSLKALIADKLSLGSTLTIIITDEEISES